MAAIGRWDGGGAHLHKAHNTVPAPPRAIPAGEGDIAHLQPMRGEEQLKPGPLIGRLL